MPLPMRMSPLPIARGSPRVRRRQFAPYPKVKAAAKLIRAQIDQESLVRSEAVGFMSLVRRGLPQDIIRHIIVFAGSFRGVVVDYFTRHTKTVTSLAVGSAGIASGDDAGVIHLRDLSGHLVHTINGPDSSVMAMAFMSGGNLAAMYYAGITKVWNLSDGTCQYTIARGEDAYCMEAFPDGTLAVGYYDGLIVFYRGRNVLANVRTHNAPVVGLAIMADGRLASCSRTGRVCIHASNGYVTIELPDSIWSLSRLGDGIAVGCGAGTIAHIGPDGRVHKTTHPHNFSVTALRELSDGSLVSGSDDCQLQVRGPGGRLRRELNGDINAIVPVPASTRLVDGELIGIPERVCVAAGFDLLTLV
jgi:hypothetical protein